MACQGMLGKVILIKNIGEVQISGNRLVTRCQNLLSKERKFNLAPDYVKSRIFCLNKLTYEVLNYIML